MMDNVNIRPTIIPTDSIYKFSAISGLLLVLIFVASIFFFLAIEYQAKAKWNLHPAYQNSSQFVPQIDKRLLAIKEKRCSEVTIFPPGMETCDRNEREMLRGIRANHIETIEHFESDLSDKKFLTLLDFLKENMEVFLFAMAVYISAMVISFCWGFSRWRSRIQKPQDELLVLQIEMAKLEILKLKKTTKRRLRKSKAR